MGEDMADASDPGDKYIQAYSTWSEGGWGGLLTGMCCFVSIRDDLANTARQRGCIREIQRLKWLRFFQSLITSIYTRTLEKMGIGLAKQQYTHDRPASASWPTEP